MTMPLSPLEAVNAAGIAVGAHVGLEIVPEQALQGGAGLFPVEQIAQAAEIGVPLAAELVDFAAMAYLVFQLPGLLVPVPGAGLLVVGVEQLPIGQADGLVEVGAVEQVLFCPGLSLFKQGAVRGRCFRLAQVSGHFLAGPQGAR